MHPVLVVFLFFVAHKLVGAQVLGSVDTLDQCHQVSAAILAAHKGQGPIADDNKPSVPFPLCIDTTKVGAQLKDPYRERDI